MEEEAQPIKKQSKFGFGFWIMVFFAVIKDGSDILLNLTAILAPLTFFTGIFMNIALFVYFFILGITPSNKKMISFATSSIIDLVPFANLMPMTTANLFLIRYLDNKENEKSNK